MSARHTPLYPQRAPARDNLLALGASERQAGELMALTPRLRYLLGPRGTTPAVQQQREALAAMSDAIRRVEVAFGVASRLADSDGLGIALRKRLDRIVGADLVRASIEELLDAASVLEIAVDDAISGLPPGQQKRQRARIAPVRLIHAVIPNIPPSKKETSRFFRIVRLLYTEVGFPDVNPEAAIRQYREGLDRRWQKI